jgi:hypothetical protein
MVSALLRGSSLAELGDRRDRRVIAAIAKAKAKAKVRAEGLEPPRAKPTGT